MPVLLALLALLPGCMGRYFRDAGAPPAVVHADLGELRWQEYWTGIIFNGDKVGFSRLAVRPAPDQPGRYVIESEASLLFQLLGFRKTVQMHSHDVVEGDLTLVQFHYRHNLDGNALEVQGDQRNGVLHATIVNRGRSSEQQLHPAAPVYPASALTLLPVIRGLEVGREYRYQIYSGETQSLLDVHQKVAGYEESDLFPGKAYKVETVASGHTATTWIDVRGRPQFELALNGVIISVLETATEAKHYLALAALNKRDTLVDFSLVRPDHPLRNPRSLQRLRLSLAGAPQAPPEGPGQHCDAASERWVCDVVAGVPEPGSPVEAGALYLQSSVTVPADTQIIHKTALSIVGEEQNRRVQIDLILRWIQANIRRVPVDAFSAVDVLEQREAECQGHAYLYAALARSLGIPTRVVNGLVYSEATQGFLYHSWAESYLDDGWYAVDPTFGQPVADATHLKLIEGESISDLLPLLDWVGKVRIDVLEPQ
jgi:transglutaminase-like putative cysteine protease